MLTVLSVASSLFLFTTLQTALRELTQPATSEDAALRIVVRHKVSLANVLPEKYQSRIERMPGVARCMKLTWFGGIYKDEKNFFPQFACEADRLFHIFSESVIEPKQWSDFVKERTACVVGIKTMERFGWKIGDKITLLGALWPCDVELIIRGVYREGIDETNLFFHHEYFDDLMGKKGLVGTFWIRATSTAVIPDLIERIDAAFKNSDAETKTETERAFQLGFVSMFGNIKMLIGSICTVIIFTMILVTGSTMSMAIRERGSEIAILKAIGFGNPQVVGLILAESFSLAIAGGFLGCFGAWAVFHNVDIYKVSHGFFIRFEVTPHILFFGLLIAAGLGVVSCVGPAYASVKTNVIEGLKTLD
ncbi:MAG TPA: FtsX-like permease family protein [Verrucomicrobiae bacterium]